MTVRVFKDQEFHRWAAKEGLSDDDIAKAAKEIEAGLVEARLGGFLLKKRVAAAGRGKRGGHRTIVAHRQGGRLVFLHGFSKNEKANISSKEQAALRELGDYYMSLTDVALAKMVEDHSILEIKR
jgi:hypothetical protein